MRPGTRIVSHSFTMAEWEADETADVEGHAIYHWIVPAKVGGNWKLDQALAGELTFTQNFQKLSGTARTDSKSVDIQEAKLSGDRISFVLPGEGGKVQYSGRVGAKTMQGTTSGGRKWSAARMQGAT